MSYPVRNYDPKTAWILLEHWFNEHSDSSCSSYTCYSALNNTLDRLHHQSTSNKLKMVYQCFTPDQIKQLKIWLVTLTITKPDIYKMDAISIEAIRLSFNQVKRLLVIL